MSVKDIHIQGAETGIWGPASLQWGEQELGAEPEALLLQWPRASLQPRQVPAESGRSQS